ncbi:hypothetical protein PROFUN_11342 [Planoprotostelium fungivorum]|uniref:Ubiquitin-like domain-containing protein n=1 Tax=Planoprotostelium fungivorum TaxID=1890364 RepID=A0A2P6NAC5_9EUKA|nr:hypothetical protein PROFUN_11342 [Planoprotostelium fungivorum]
MSHGINSISKVEDTIEIKLVALSKHHYIRISPTATILELKTKTRESGWVAPGKNIRLIFGGKILSDTQTLSSSGIHNGSSVHCSVSDSVSVPVMQDPQEEIRGFNRLRTFGFNQSEIDHIRTQFHTHRLVNNGFLHANTNVEQQLSLEEEWINSEGLNANRDVQAEQPPIEETSTDTGDNEDIFKGLVMGFALGLVMLLWLPDRSLPFRMKLGIVAGLSASFLFGTMRLMSQ